MDLGEQLCFGYSPRLDVPTGEDCQPAFGAPSPPGPLKARAATITHERRTTCMQVAILTDGAYGTGGACGTGRGVTRRRRILWRKPGSLAVSPWFGSYAGLCPRSQPERRGTTEHPTGAREALRGLAE